MRTEVYDQNFHSSLPTRICFIRVRIERKFLENIQTILDRCDIDLDYEFHSRETMRVYEELISM